MSRSLVFILFAMLLVGCDGGQTQSATGNAMQPFAPGQTWTYRTRPGEEASRIVICRVESHPRLGEIVHIHVNGLRFTNKHAPGGTSDKIGHMPYAAEALRTSVTRFESISTALPDFENGYQEWRTAFDEGQAGVWTVSVSEAIAGMEAALNQ